MARRKVKEGAPRVTPAMPGMDSKVVTRKDHKHEGEIGEIRTCLLCSESVAGDQKALEQHWVDAHGKRDEYKCRGKVGAKSRPCKRVFPMPGPRNTHEFKVHGLEYGGKISRIGGA